MMRFRTVCPACGTENDAATGVRTSGQPKPGDLNYCCACRVLSIYDEDPVTGELVSRAFTKAEREQVFADPEVQKALRRLDAAPGR